MGDIIVNLDGIVDSLALQSTNVDTMITQARTIFEQLAARRGEMVDSLDSIALVADQVATLSSDVAPDLSEFLTREPGFAQHFLDNKDTFGYFGFKLPPMLKGLARASQDGSYINTYLCNLNPPRPGDQCRDPRDRCAVDARWSDYPVEDLQVSER